jgi:predicted nuclease of predicted toxin-antitoxin system
MAIKLLVDVHVDSAIVRQLRLRQVEVATAQELGVDRIPDNLLLEHATRLGRPLFTHDIRFFAMAQKWIVDGKPFGGLIFAHLMQVSIGRCVHDLEIIAKATDPEDWQSSVLRLPL